MAHIRRRTRKVRKADWLAEHTAPDGRRHSRSFAKKADAERYLINVESAKLRGLYTDPKLGKTPFGDWLKTWWSTTSGLRSGRALATSRT